MPIESLIKDLVENTVKIKDKYNKTAEDLKNALVESLFSEDHHAELLVKILVRENTTPDDFYNQLSIELEKQQGLEIDACQDTYQKYQTYCETLYKQKKAPADEQTSLLQESKNSVEKKQQPGEQGNGGTEAGPPEGSDLTPNPTGGSTNGTNSEPIPEGANASEIPPPPPPPPQEWEKRFVSDEKQLNSGKNPEEISNKQPEGILKGPSGQNENINRKKVKFPENIPPNTGSEAQLKTRRRVPYKKPKVTITIGTYQKNENTDQKNLAVYIDIPKGTVGQPRQFLVDLFDSLGEKFKNANYQINEEDYVPDRKLTFDNIADQATKNAAKKIILQMTELPWVSRRFDFSVEIE